MGCAAAWPSSNQAPGGAGGLVAEARALVWPQRVALLGVLERVQALGDAAGSQPRELVLCHGDLRGDNLLGDRAGRVWLVDWDGAVLAPRERDLVSFTGQGFARFLAGYQRAADRGIEVDADLLAFFLLRRNLDDLVDWLGAVLGDDRPVEQRRADLDGVGWCLSRWAALDPHRAHPPGAGVAATVPLGTPILVRSSARSTGCLDTYQRVAERRRAAASRALGTRGSRARRAADAGGGGCARS